MLQQLDLQNILVLDIETVPQFSSFEELPENMQKLWDLKTRFQRKDQETPDEFYQRAGIWAEFGKIICSSVGIFKNNQSFRVKSFYSHNESELLEEFIHLLNGQ